MFDAPAEEYAWWPPQLPAATTPVAPASDPLTEEERARLRFHRWRLARQRATPAAPDAPLGEGPSPPSG